MRRIAITRSLLFAAAISFALAVSCGADGIYLPRIPHDPRDHARDITEPTQKAVVAHFGDKERLILQVSYKGNAKEFAWLVPTPSRPSVSKFEKPIFHELHDMTCPAIVYWLDAPGRLREIVRARGRTEKTSAMALGPSVEVLEEKQVGFYDIAVLKAQDAGDLLKWLHRNGYNVTSAAERILSDYIRKGWVFTAARIHTANLNDGAGRLSEGVLQSVQFDFRSLKPIYPLRISSLNQGETEVLIYAYCDWAVEAPPLEAVCSFSSIDYDFSRPDDPFWTEDPQYHSYRLTKLRGVLGPEQMKQDLTLVRSKDQSERNPPDQWPPFLENLGALFVLLASWVFWVPYNLGAVAVCLVASRMEFGRRHEVRWFIAAILSFFAPIPFLILATASADNYRPVGIAALVIVALVVVLAGRAVTRRKKAI
jgi:hypothetical protein